ncbi:hypothetical protein [Rhodovarius lipocyclicus]|uniref:hypothetical protein n=1 Tax=Rhodovarius lipocyclicus TaxID=268410 RepID=UPI00135CADE0|nr:hypothetical protein [Rhodovarius lipocyclicus]
MPDIKIPQLPAAGTLADDDLLLLTQGNTSAKLPFAAVVSHIMGGVMDALGSSGSPIAGLHLSPAGDSRRTSVTFGNEFQMGVDIGSNGGEGFFLYHSASNAHPYTVDDLGRSQFWWRNNAPSDDANSYAPVGWAVNVLGGNGITAPATGTLMSHRTECAIGAILSAGNGTRSEHTANYNVTYAYKGLIQEDWNLWAEDCIVMDAPAGDVIGGRTRDAPNWFVGKSVRLHAFNDLTALGPGCSGSFGISLVTRPLTGEEAALDPTGSRVGDSTRPLLAMFSAAGFSGLNGDTIQSGTDAGAGDAAVYGLRIGGGGGSVYGTYDARSRFRFGGLLADWREEGLRIAAPLPGFSGPGLVIEPGCDPSLIGDVEGSVSEATLVIGPRAAGAPPLSLRSLPLQGDSVLKPGDLYRTADGTVKWMPE